MHFKVDAVRKALDERGALSGCPVCGHRNLTLHETPVLLSHLDVQSEKVSDKFSPMVMIVCDRCGFTRLHHLAKLAGK